MNNSSKPSCKVDNPNGKEGVFLSDEYLQIIEDFTEWLSRVNYAKATVKCRKRQLRRFLLWLTQNKIPRLEEVRKSHLEAYNLYLHSLPFARQTIEAHIGVLKILNKFRAAYELRPVLTTHLIVTKDVMVQRVVLSKEEVDQLYKACEESIFGHRDKAMLAIYYGCGLRYQEGVHLQITDINFETEVLLVRKGKGYRQRYVPLSSGTKTILKDWLQKYKPLLGIKSNLILPRRDGKRIKGNALNIRLKKLAERAEIDKRVTLHVLRHSIATHLTQNGMELESVSQFLGHLHLQTTMKYVHIAAGI